MVNDARIKRTKEETHTHAFRQIEEDPVAIPPVDIESSWPGKLFLNSCLWFVGVRSRDINVSRSYSKKATREVVRLDVWSDEVVASCFDRIRWTFWIGFPSLCWKFLKCLWILSICCAVSFHQWWLFLKCVKLFYTRIGVLVEGDVPGRTEGWTFRQDVESAVERSESLPNLVNLAGDCARFDITRYSCSM